MGYSAATPCKSTKAQKRMLAFLEKHYRPWTDIQDKNAEDATNPDYDFTRFITTDLDYDRGKCRIGYNFTCSSEPDGEYGFAVMRWMALQIGRARKFPGFATATPYIVYDGDEAWPVPSVWETTVPDKYRWALVNENGFKPLRRPWLPPDPKHVERKIIVKSIPDMAPILKEYCKYPEIQAELVKLGPDFPDTIDGDEPTGLFYMHQTMKKHGCDVELEYGSFVLAGWRKEMADRMEPRIAAREIRIQDELQRLTDLWKDF